MSLLVTQANIYQKPVCQNEMVLARRCYGTCKAHATAGSDRAPDLQKNQIILSCHSLNVYVRGRLKESISLTSKHHIYQLHGKPLALFERY
jgi:hypothetical protein